MTIAESNDTPAAESNVRRSYARHEVPEPLREDVRLLGRLLGTYWRSRADLTCWPTWNVSAN